ncbi:hypothetical protein [uncultured Endozoicomonas sp.]|uniref:hypothetical protein n=1 Tax=uncultured Endozoicomonas sp. TaxID=432652 RepID=UPI00260304D2|nr:hypothetical protein [uncultured Endozoicomonas sp.]
MKKRAKQSNKKKNNQDSSRNKSADSFPSVTQFKHPLSNLNDEERKKFVEKVSTESKKKLVEYSQDIENTLREYDPITLISILSCYCLTVGGGDNGVQVREEPDMLSQSHIEYLQALVLTLSTDDIGWMPPTPEVVESTRQKLIVLSQSFHFSRMNSDLVESSEKELAITQIQESFRGSTQVVRNWGYFSQVRNISMELYSPFDEMLKSKIGCSCTEIINFFETLTEITEDNVTNRFKNLSKLKRIKSKEKLIIEYCKLIGQSEEYAETFKENFDLNKISQKNLFVMLMSHYDIRSDECYYINNSEIKGRARLDEETVLSILKLLSYDLEGLREAKKEYFFLDNPVWEKPIIKTDKGYFCALPQLFFSFILTTLDEIIEIYDKKGLHQRRADYLEIKIDEIVKRRFPDSKTISGLKWKKDNTEYETDLITFIDSQAIIIEAKSHRISKPALRGAPNRIKRHLTEILVDPSIQSVRLKDELDKARLNKSSNEWDQKLPVNIHEIHNIIRVSVSLENFASLQASLDSFEKTGWLPHDFQACPSMTLADFETVFDFLDHPVQIVHYLRRRTDLEGKVSFKGDELDLLGLYRETLLTDEELSFDDLDNVIITGMSKPLDKYYISKDQGIEIPKPAPKITQRFKDIFKQLENRSTPRWTEIGCILNQISPRNQIELSKHIKNFSKIVQRTWRNEEHNNLIVFNPPENCEYSLAVALFKNENSDMRDHFINRATEEALTPENT